MGSSDSQNELPLRSRSALDYSSKALVFSHFGTLRYGEEDAGQSLSQPEFAQWMGARSYEWAASKPRYEEFFGPILRSYLKCARDGKRLAIVYAYVDWAVRQAIRANIFTRDTLGGGIEIPGDLLTAEEEIVGFLRYIENTQRKSLGLSPIDPPVFHYIGLQKLLSLLQNIVHVDPRLTKFLCGEGDVFTYDSPKFVEAVIRLARGDVPHLAPHPILRVDEDAELNAFAVEALLNAHSSECTRTPFYFFSGQYGSDSGIDDPINDHAVRVHWFAEVGHRRGEPISDPDQEKRISTFLADLSELGATQIPNSSISYSSGLKSVLLNRSAATERGCPQVISGAGLIMSCRAVSLLPPFMNIGELTTWVDDLLKRRLHEAIGDLGPFEVEIIKDARISQDRHRPAGIDKDDLKEDKIYSYLQRLLRGCLFRHIITELDGSPTRYSNLIANIVSFRVVEGSPELSDEQRADLRDEMVKRAQVRYEEVKAAWTSVEYEGSLSYTLWNSLDPDHQTDTCHAVAHDADTYLDLVVSWPIFARAIQRLSMHGNHWLYHPVD